MSSQRTFTDYTRAEPVDGQGTTRDLSVLEQPGDCRSCGGDVSDEVLRIVGKGGRVDACGQCYVGGADDDRPVETDASAARRAHRDPTWPRDLGGGE